MKFNFAVSSTTKRPARTTEPELTTTPTLNKIRINEAASLLLNVKHGENIMVISNYDAVVAAATEEGLKGDAREEFIKENVQYGVAKSVAVTRNGVPKISVKKLTVEEKAAVENGTYEGEVDEKGRPTEIDYHGAKLACSTKSTALGQILEFSDAKHWPLFGGNEEDLVVFSIDKTPMNVELNIDGQDMELDVFLIKEDRHEEKLVRESAK